MQQKINAVFTKRVLELNGSLGFNDSLSSCNSAYKIYSWALLVKAERYEAPFYYKISIFDITK